jgi:hypothetical protein
MQWLKAKLEAEKLTCKYPQTLESRRTHLCTFWKMIFLRPCNTQPTKWEGLGPGNRNVFGPCETASSR